MAEMFVYIPLVVLGILMMIAGYSEVFIPLISLVAGFDVSVVSLNGATFGQVIIIMLLGVAMMFGVPIGFCSTVFFWFKFLAVEPFKDQKALRNSALILLVGVGSIVVLGLLYRYWHSVGTF